MTRVFITGATGVVGRPVLRRLVERKDDVVALARSEGSSALLGSHGARPVRGDVTDEGSLTRAMEGCETVFHIAGLNGMCLREADELRRVNVLGSLAVLRAAARAGVAKLVYTSSATTVGERQGETGHERSQHRGYFLSDYERSKYEAEKALLAAPEAERVAVVSVNPSSVQGPGRAGGTARILRAYLNGKLRVFVDTTVSLVDIDDCAEGHLLAERKGVAGERYILSGATLTTRAALDIVAHVTGLRERPRTVPSSLALAGAGIVEAGARLARREAPVCREMVRTLVHGHAYDGSRATRELGLGYRPVEDTLRRTVEWLVAEGLVSRSLPRLPV